MLPLTENSLHHPETIAFARRAELLVDDTINAKFPATTGARIIIKTPTGQHQREVMHPLGDPANPMSRDRLLAKFNAATRALNAGKILSAIAEFDNGQYAPLVSALADRCVLSANEQ